MSAALDSGSDRVRLPDGRSGRLILDHGQLAIVFGRPAVTVFDEHKEQLVEPAGPGAREKLLSRLRAACAAAKPAESTALVVVISPADRILAAAEMIQRGRAMIAEGQALVDAGVGAL